MIKVISTKVCQRTNEVKEYIELNFPPEKKQETKVLKWLKNLRTEHEKKQSYPTATKLIVNIIHC